MGDLGLSSRRLAASGGQHAFSVCLRDDCGGPNWLVEIRVDLPVHWHLPVHDGAGADTGAFIGQRCLARRVLRHLRNHADCPSLDAG